MNDISILVIEDNDDVRENIAEILELAEYKVFTAKNGKEGVELAKKNHPNLILCDIMMPELDGYGVLRILENSEDMIGTPFIFLTAKSEKGDFRKGMDLGADDYLVKPFDGNELLKVISARLNKNQVMKKKFSNSLEGLNDFLGEVKTLEGISLLSEKKTAKKIKKKDVVFLEGDLPTHIYFVASGKIKTSKINEAGKEYISGIHKEGDFFGYTVMLDDTKHNDSAIAIEDSEIVQIPKQDFYKLLYSNQDISIKFIKLLTNNLAEAEDKLLKLAYNSARKKVADALLFVYRKNMPGKENESFSLLRENLSAIAGIAPESVSRNLSDFREEGLIETYNGRVKIMNLKKLETLHN